MDAGRGLATVGTGGLGGCQGANHSDSLLFYKKGVKVQMVIGWKQLSAEVVYCHRCSPTCR